MRGYPPLSLLRRVVGAGRVDNDNLESVAGIDLSVDVLRFVLDVFGLVMCGYGDCDRGRVLKASLHVARSL